VSGLDPATRARGSGAIINVTSVAGRVPGNAFGRLLRLRQARNGNAQRGTFDELEPYGIRVISIESGFFSTEIITNADDFPRDFGPYAA